MTGWLKLTDEQRIISITQAATISGITAKAVEKDWWVTLTLKALYGTSSARFFIFKGGTSLSKSWKLIERFSEDIDIALDPQAFQMEYIKNPSHGYVKKLKREGCKFTSSTILNELTAQFNKLGIPQELITLRVEDIPNEMPDKDPQTIYVSYKSLFPPHEYIADEVKIEFGVRSFKEPYSNMPVQSILSEFFPNRAYEELPFEVIVVDPQKTLLEKAFLLHEKFLSKNIENIKVERLSRHLYDLEKLMNSDVGIRALKDHGFFSILLEHRRAYVRLRDIDYNTLDYHTLSFIPPTDELMEMFRQDYRIMQSEMIYGDSLEFNMLIEKLKILRGRFRLIREHKTLEKILEDAEIYIINNPPLYNDEGAKVTVPISYISDPFLPPGPNNENRNYQIDFIRKDDNWVFEDLTIIR